MVCLGLALGLIGFSFRIVGHIANFILLGVRFEVIICHSRYYKAPSYTLRSRKLFKDGAAYSSSKTETTTIAEAEASISTRGAQQASQTSRRGEGGCIDEQ